MLAGALAANRRARLADATILKILGATRTRLTLMFLIEYAILGAATAAFGVGAGTLAAYGWSSAASCSPTSSSTGGPRSPPPAAALPSPSILGMIGAWRILSQKPAAYLREL